MILVIGAVVVGILIGLAFGGSVLTLSESHLRWWPLAILGLALQLVPVPSLEGSLDHWLGVGLLIVSYSVLLAFVAANIRMTGFPIVAVGFALNVLAISANGGMPVSSHALRVAYGSGYEATFQNLQLHGGPKHHLQRPDDVLLPITDVIPIGTPVHKVFSAGDLVSLLGITWVIAGATRGPVGKHRFGAARLRQERRGGRASPPAPVRARPPSPSRRPAPP